jgi:hypothetical protein
MSGFSLSVRIDPPFVAREPLSGDRLERDTAFCRALYHRYGLKLFSVAWTAFDLLGWPRLPEFLREVELMTIARREPLGSAIVTETVDPAESPEWYVVRADRPRHECQARPYPLMAADRVPATLNVMQDGVLVSERFKLAVERAGLTGLEFLWVADTGRFAAQQWYVAVAQHSLGRGVDHPAYDPRLGTPTEVPTRASGRYAHGVFNFDSRYMNPSWSTGRPEADRLLSLFGRTGPLDLLLYLARHVRREDVPSTDFAYDWSVESLGPEWSLRNRELCVSARAYAALTAAEVLQPRDVTPVVVVNGAPPLVPPVDDLPAPVFTRDELAALRIDEAKRLQRFCENPKPPRAADLTGALKLLRAARRAAPDRFGAPVRPAALATMEAALPPNRGLPEAWRRVLGVSDGMTITGDHEIDIAPAAELPALQAEFDDVLRQSDDEHIEGYIVVGTTATGDHLALSTSEQKDDDCPVVLIDHETLEPAERWESIADAIESLIG